MLRYIRKNISKYLTRELAKNDRKTSVQSGKTYPSKDVFFAIREKDGCQHKLSKPNKRRKDAEEVEEEGGNLLFPMF